MINKCGECTVCCTLSVVEELNKKAFDACSLCKNNGCSIYGKHPQVCKDFKCAYLESGTDNISLRPDKCNVMFVKKSDRIFVGTVFPNKLITNTARGQIESFNKQGYSVILLKEKQRPFMRLAEGHIKEEIYNEYLMSLKNGNL